MTSRIEQALDELREWDCWELERVDLMFTALRAGAAYMVTLECDDCDEIILAPDIPGFIEIINPDCGTCASCVLRSALNALATSVLGEEVPTDGD